MRHMRRRWGGRVEAVGLVTLWLFAGCAKPPIVEKPVGKLGKEEVLTQLNSRATETKGLQAKLDVKVRTSKMKREESCGGSLWAGHPDRLRIRGKHDLLDYPPFDIGADGKTWFVHTQFEKQNEMHVGPTAALEEKFDPAAPVRPSDVVLALGVGALEDAPPKRELFLTRNPGQYVITELANNASGRYISRRMWVDAEKMVITRIETYRPDEGIDMIAEMTFDKNSEMKTVPVKARIRLLRKDAFLLELTLKERKTGEIAPGKARRVFRVPQPEDARIIEHK